MTRRFVKWAWVPVFLAFVLAAGAPAQAHTQIRALNPEAGAELQRPPEQVKLVLEETAEAEFSPLKVYDAEGQRVDRDNARLAPDDPNVLLVDLEPSLPSGSYTVEYRYTGTDGHTIKGSYQFSVSRSSGEAAAGEDAAAESDSSQGSPDAGIPRGVFVVTGAFALALLGLLVLRGKRREGA